MGRRGVAAIRARHRHPDHPALRRNEPWHYRPLRLQALVQSELRRGRQSDGLVGHAPPLRHRPGTGRVDDRELPIGSHLGHHARLPSRDRGTTASRVHRRLALRRRLRGSMAAAIRVLGFLAETVSAGGFNRDPSPGRRSR